MWSNSAVVPKLFKCQESKDRKLLTVLVIVEFFFFPVELKAVVHGIQELKVSLGFQHDIIPCTYFF